MYARECLFNVAVQSHPHGIFIHHQSHHIACESIYIPYHISLYIHIYSCLCAQHASVFGVGGTIRPYTDTHTHAHTIYELKINHRKNAITKNDTIRLCSKQHDTHVGRQQHHANQSGDDSSVRWRAQLEATAMTTGNPLD